MNFLLSALTSGQMISTVVAVIILVVAVAVIISVLAKQNKLKKSVDGSKSDAVLAEQESQSDAVDNAQEQDNLQDTLEHAQEEKQDTPIVEQEQSQEDVEDSVAEDGAIEDTIVEESAIEEEDVEDIEVKDIAIKENKVEDSKVEESVVENKIVEEEPIEETPAEEAPEQGPAPIPETHPFAQDKPVEPIKPEKKVAEKKQVIKSQARIEAEKKLAELKPSSDRERAVIVDDKPVLIKDDRFLFSPDEDGFYYVLEKTFTAKVIQSSDVVKEYYTELKNELLSYKKIHARMSKKRESFNFGRQCLARLSIRGKTIRLHLALDANDYADTKYKVEDTSSVKSLADTPLLYRIRNNRRDKYAKDLIATVMAKYGVQRQEIQPVNYAENYPYEPTEVLIEKGLITKRRVQGRVPEGNGFEFAQKTFKAKLIQSEEIVKEYYSQIKNHLLTYRKIHDRMSKTRESFRFGRTCMARMSIRGKTLKLYLALDANDYADSKYKVEDVSSVKAYADTPLLYRIKNTRRLRYALDLIDTMMTNFGVLKKRDNEQEHDYVADLPYESTEELLEEGLIVNKFVAGNTFIAQHFKFKERDAEQEVASEKVDTDEPKG